MIDEKVKSIITGVREFYLGLLSSNLPPEAFDLARRDTVTLNAYQGVAERFVALLNECGAVPAQASAAEVVPTIPHKQCKTPGQCRTEQFCMDSWHCCAAAANNPAMPAHGDTSEYSLSYEQIRTVAAKCMEPGRYKLFMAYINKVFAAENNPAQERMP